MIFKIEFKDDDNRVEFCQAKDLNDLHAGYEEEYGEEEVLNFKSVTIIDDETAKTIKLVNTEHDETDPESPADFTLFEAAVGDDFCIIGSTEW